MLIHAETMREVGTARIREVERRAGLRAQVQEPAGTPPVEPPVLVRMQRTGDEAALERLAQLDSAPAPRGCMVVAERGGEIVAAAPLDGSSRPIADPFRPSAEAVALVLERAAALRRVGRPSRLRRLRLAFQR
jgi:hypothetical protein